MSEFMIMSTGLLYLHFRFTFMAQNTNEAIHYLHRVLTLGYGRKQRSRKKKGECELREIQCDCYWVEVNKREENME
jgi:5-carboxymethyl-2-hydroxymuconate isomerase